MSWESFLVSAILGYWLAVGVIIYVVVSSSRK
jgi:hypothetical protein